MTLMTRTLLALGIASVLISSCTSSHAATDGGTDATTDSGAPVWASCTDNGQCMVISASCCGSCGQPTTDDMIAVNRDHVSDYRGGSCDGIGCPACFMEPNPNLIATCDAGTCRALDVSTRPISSCSADSECTLRAPSCCACSSSAPIAIRADAEADFQSLVCVGDEVCPECVPAFPDWSAACITGHCTGLQVRAMP